MTTSAPPYERIAPLVVVAIIGLALILFLDSTPHMLHVRWSANAPPLALSWPLLLFLAAITSIGADMLVRSHPQLQHRTLPTIRIGTMSIELLPSVWALPAMSVIGSFAFFRAVSSSHLTLVLVLIGTGAILVTVLQNQYEAYDHDLATQQHARLILPAVAYLLMLECLCAILVTHDSPIIIALLTSSTAALLAYDVFQWTQPPDRIMLALLIGLVLGQASWALSYWPLPWLPRAVALLAIFYTSVNLIAHHAAGTLQQRLMVEYGLFGGGLVAAMIYVAFQ